MCYDQKPFHLRASFVSNIILDSCILIEVGVGFVFIIRSSLLNGLAFTLTAIFVLINFDFEGIFEIFRSPARIRDQQ